MKFKYISYCVLIIGYESVLFVLILIRHVNVEKVYYWVLNF